MMFSIEEVVSTSGLYWLMLLEDVGIGPKLFPGNGLALLGLNLDFVLSHRDGLWPQSPHVRSLCMMAL